MSPDKVWESSKKKVTSKFEQVQVFKEKKIISPIFKTIQNSQENAWEASKKRPRPAKVSRNDPIHEEIIGETSEKRTKKFRSRLLIGGMLREESLEKMISWKQIYWEMLRKQQRRRRTLRKSGEK